MRNLVFVLTILILVSCGDKKPNSAVKTSSTLQNLTSIKNDIKFPILAVFKNHSKFDGDTLIVTVDKTEFLITPEGKLSWGKNLADTIHLQTELIVEKAYLYKNANILLVFYTETNSDDSSSRVEKIDLGLKKSIWQAEIQGFNLGLPYLIDNIAYLTSIGFVGKLNVDNGKYCFQFIDLYDTEKYSFNSFDTITFKDSLTIFKSKNYHSNNMDSVIVNEKTGEITTRK